MSEIKGQAKDDSKLMQLLAATHSLHASHEIASELERSKCRSEQTIDNLPIPFGVVSEAGIVFRANQRFAELFALNMEECLGHKISELFSDGAGAVFFESLSKLESHENRDATIEIKVTLDSPSIKKADMVWSIRPYGKMMGTDYSVLYQVIGHQ